MFLKADNAGGKGSYDLQMNISFVWFLLIFLSFVYGSLNTLSLCVFFVIISSAQASFEMLSHSMFILDG